MIYGRAVYVAPEDIVFERTALKPPEAGTLLFLWVPRRRCRRNRRRVRPMPRTQPRRMEAIMTIESAIAAADARDAWEAAFKRWQHLDELRREVRAELETLEAEYSYWHRVAENAWAGYQILDSRFCDARDRVTAPRQKADQPSVDKVSA